MMNPLALVPETKTHPLEPLSSDEVAAAANILKVEKGLDDNWRFVFIMLHEPPKDAVRAWSADAPQSIPREAEGTLRHRASRGTYEALVSLSEGRVLDFKRMDGVQAPVTFEEFMATEDVVRADPRWQAAMTKRGVTDFELCMLDPWAASHTEPADDPSLRRIVRPLTWVRSEPGDNGYARPVEGL